MNTPKNSGKPALRKALRKQRRQLSIQQQRKAAFGLAKNARLCHAINNAQRVLSYAPFAGEISPEQFFFSNNTETYLPRITNYRLGQMRFYRQNLSHVNRFGMREPRPVGDTLPANAFDLILLPLVAFDRRGSRLGMGAGFYDRALASLAHQSSTRPTLVGLAHHFQEVSTINASTWDVPLDAILTDRELIVIS